MRWLDKGVSPEEFGKFKTEVNQKLNELTDKVQRKITDDEAAANLSAQNAQAAEQRILATEEAVATALGDLEKYRDQALAELQNLQQQVSTNSESNKTLSEHIEQNKVLHSQILSAKAQVDEFVASITQSHTVVKTGTDLFSSDVPQYQGPKPVVYYFPYYFEQDPQMNEQVRDAILTTFTASAEGRMHFDEVIAQLMALAVESYQVDYRSGRATYFLPDGDTLDLAFERPKRAIPEAFDGDAVRAAIRGAQAGKVLYPEFKQLTQHAGCIGYTVWISGRHVAYMGRRGEVHIERFPD